MYIEPFNACMRKNTYLSMPAKPAALSYIFKSKKGEIMVYVYFKTNFFC